jgi:hypothetical protein
MCIGLYIKYPLFFSGFNEYLISLQILEKESFSLKTRRVGAEFHASGETDRQT